MKRIKDLFAVYVVATLVVAGFGIQVQGQRRSEKQVRDTVRSLASKIDDFQYSLNNQLRSSSADRQDIDDVGTSLRNLQGKVSDFESNLDQKRENRDDIQAIITAAKDVDAFLSQNRQNGRLETSWEGVRDQINRLASQYGVTPDWSRRVSSYPDKQPNYPPQMSTPSSYNSGLAGTYELDAARSENISDIISNSGVGSGQRQDLESKLEAPEQIALDVRGNQVTLATSKAAPITFTADGREKTENSGGRTVRLKATMNGQQLTVSSLGGQTDYTITFVSSNNGNTLKVTRRMTTDYLRETIFAESIYNKTDQVAQLGIDHNGGNASANQPADDTYSSNDPNDRNGNSNSPNPTLSQGRTGEFIVPNGTMVTGQLESTIDTKVSQNNDRFKITVQSPDEFRGAVIEGYITGVGRSGQVSGRSNITFNFERITLRNGQSYDFAGYLQAIKDQNGKPVKVDTEGTAKGDSQTKETAKRGGIGAGLGAVIGAIAGGGKGAAIGAIIGGGAGAGSVIAQGRDDIQLLKGSMITVQASSPARGEQPVSEN
jgi:hypothetical protein